MERSSLRKVQHTVLARLLEYARIVWTKVLQIVEASGYEEVMDEIDVITKEAISYTPGLTTNSLDRLS